MQNITALKLVVSDKNTFLFSYHGNQSSLVLYGSYFWWTVVEDLPERPCKSSPTFVKFFRRRYRLFEVVNCIQTDDKKKLTSSKWTGELNNFQWWLDTAGRNKFEINTFAKNVLTPVLHRMSDILYDRIPILDVVYLANQ